MEQLLLATIIACTTGQATCSAHDAGEYDVLYACNITPDQKGKRQLRVNFEGRYYLLILEASCDSA